MHYTDTQLWQKSVEAAHLTRQLCLRLPDYERFGLADQMRRASISIPSNIAEGWGREAVRDKAHFLAIAQSSLNELNTQMILAERGNLLSTSDLEPIRELWLQVDKMLSRLRGIYRDSAPKKAARDQARAAD